MRALETFDLVAGYHRGRRRAEVVAVDHLVARSGDLVAVVGPNGAGKSTLLRTLIGTQPALRGTIRIGGVELSRLDRRERARKVAVVLTDRIDAGLLSVGEVVQLGRHPHTGWNGRLGTDDVAVARAAAAELGVEDLWGTPYAEISDGQRQRVLVARALAQEPAVLVLDEPTAYLDVAGRVELTAALATLAHVGGLSVVSSTHDLDLALSHADRVWLVDRGTVVDDVPEALATDGRLAAAFETEAVTLDPVTSTFRRRTPPGRPIAVADPRVARLVARLGAVAVASIDEGDGWSIVQSEAGWEFSHDLAVERSASLAELSVAVRRSLGEPGRSPVRLRS